MDQSEADYYTSRYDGILALFDDHAEAWWPLLAERYGDDLAGAILGEARARHEELIPQLPFIGGDENVMTRHLVRSTTSLALYLAMKARGVPAAETGRIVYDAVLARVRSLPPPSSAGPSAGQLAVERAQARRSQARRYPGDWVWDVVEGDGSTFDYGYDFFQCGTQKLYHAYGADAFLPYYCRLDYATFRTPGWRFFRTMTLAEGHEKCDFRFKRDEEQSG